MGAYLEMWKRAGDLSGKTGRSRFWTAVAVDISLRFLVLFLMPLVLITCFAMEGQRVYSVLHTISYVYGMCFLIPLISMMVRRLRDAGHSPKSFLWLLLPGIGAIAFVCRLCGASVPASNNDSEI